MKHLIALAASALAVLAAPSTAQQVVFQDGFESGLTGWAATGLWHLQDQTDPCGIPGGAIDGTKAAWYGSNATCNYVTPTANHGELQTITPITLPDAPSINLRFWYWGSTEYCWAGWDLHYVRIEAANGPDDGFTQVLCPSISGNTWMLPWHERRIDLSAYRGAQVSVVFGFDTVDTTANNTFGWILDDVRIIAEPGERVCPSAAIDSNCPCMPQWVPVAGGCRNSTGQSATLLSGGTPSVGQDTLVFTAAHMPLTTLPTLFQGTTGIAPAAFGDGLRCIGGSQMRMGTLVASNGAASWPPPGSQPLSVKGLVPPVGGTRYYQVIYRNAADSCTAATFNLTEAQKIVWTP